MENERVNVKDKRDGFPIFIHSELDDYGLSNAEFRVYSRLARRAGENGIAKESIPNMADTFMVSTQTVRRCLHVLQTCRLINEQRRPGKSTIYTLNPRKVWLDKKQLPEMRALAFNPTPTTRTPTCSVRGDMTDRGGLTSQIGGPLTPQIDEGYPSEVTPLKDIHSSLPKGSGTRKKTKERDPNLDHPAVVLYRDICHITPNEQQRADIVAASVDLDRYGGVLRKFMSEGQRPNRVDWTLERYQSNGTHRPNIKNGSSRTSDFEFRPKSKI